MDTLEKSSKASVTRQANISFALFVAGGLVGLLQMRSPIPFGSGFEMVALAHNLAAHGSFANPFYVLPTGPTAANPPLYPLILAAIIKIFRLPALILAMAATANVAVNALTASLLPRVSRLLCGDTTTGVAAAILWLASMQLTPDWDTGYTVACLLLLCLLTVTSLGKGRGASYSMFAGAITGSLFLFNPSTLLITLPWIGYLGLRYKASVREIIILVTVLALIIFGWAERNRRELGAFAVRTSLGMTFYASNNDCAKPSRLADELNNCYQSHHPNTLLSEAHLLHSMGEVNYDHKRTADTVAWIRTHPRRFAHLTLARFRDFWFPPFEKHPVNACAIWLVTVLSIPGMILMRRRHKLLVYLFLVILLIYPLMYYIVVSDIRYRYPVLWLSLLPAGYFVCRLLPARVRDWMGDEA